MRLLSACALAVLLTSTAIAQSLTASPTAERTALDHVRAEAFAAGTSVDLVVSSSHANRRSGLSYVYVQQQQDGIDVAEALVTVAVGPNDRVVHAAGDLVAGVSRAPKAVSLSAEAAVAQAARLLNLPAPSTRAVRVVGGAAQKTFFAPIAQIPVSARLVYVGSEARGVRLAWEVLLPTEDGMHVWQVRLDAASGQEISRIDQVVHDHWGPAPGTYTPSFAPVRRTQPDTRGTLTPLAEAAPMAGSYTVYAMPEESPTWISSPLPTDGRDVVANPDNALASPWGWHDTNGAAGAEFTVTRGNNVYAYTDTDGNNVPDVGSSPDGGAGLVFDAALAPINLSMSATTYRPAAVINLFYWNNIYHDVMYQYGFDEASGNFQTNNYGRGGVIFDDAVYAEAQNLGNCNANFWTPADDGNDAGSGLGPRPRMQMFTCDPATVGSPAGPLTDSDLDAGVIVHEYGHGVSNRLTGGGLAITCLQNAEQMGEGWSDWYGLMLTMEGTDTRTTLRPIGNFLLGQSQSGQGIRGTGFQPPPGAPYSTNFAVNSATYGSTNSGLSQPHGIGFVWATILWEVTWDMIDAHGFNADIYNSAGTAGNQIMMNLVTEGMKLQPCSPGFVDGRDAILAADAALYPDAGNPGFGEHYTTLWAAFARRGLGASASQGSSGSRSDQVEAFDIPAPPPIFAYSPSSISETLAPGAMTTVPVTIENQANPGDNDLNWTALVLNATVPFAPREEQPEVVRLAPEVAAPTGELRVSGDLKADDTSRRVTTAPTTANRTGADGFGYTFIDSNEIGGPTYSWVDISATGTAVPLGDDDFAGPIALPFGFPFYGTVQTEVYIGSNGYLTFGAGSTDLSNDPIPSANTPNNIIAMYWDDLDPDTAPSEVRYQDMGDGRFVVSFLDVPHFPNGDGEFNTFQAILYDDGSILFQYDTFTDDASFPNSATVGIENADASFGLQVAFDEAYLANNLAVQISPPPSWISLSSSGGTVAPGASQMFNVELDATGLADGVYTADVVISTNDPLTPSATIPVTLTVNSGGPPPSVLNVTVDAPATVQQGGTIMYNVTVNNPTASPVTGRVFTEFEDGGGNIRRGPSFAGTLPAGATVVKTLSRSVPGSTPLGTYTVRAEARNGGGTVLGGDDDTFDVVAAPLVTAETAEMPQETLSTVATDTPLVVAPNPVRGEARFTFGMAEAGSVRLAVFDALGREVAVVADGEMGTGSHTATLRTEDLPSGVYVWRLMVGDRVESGRITVAR